MLKKNSHEGGLNGVLGAPRARAKKGLKIEAILARARAARPGHYTSL